MHLPLILLAVLAGLLPGLHAQPVQIDTFAVPTVGDTIRFLVQIPESYSPQNPPAIVSWWHGLGSDREDLVISGFLPHINERGWIAACHDGPNDRHWNTRRAQYECKVMFDWIMAYRPFSMDSIYIVGSSMGAAGGEVWHNNNCGLSDYLVAAVVGGSPILDCMLRQQQYLDSGHVNNSMIAAFGGLPHISDSVDFEYHRYSAVYLADTSQSLHFNTLHLPCYATWGTSDSSWTAEWFAYGRPAQEWAALRQASGSAETVAFCSGINNHGWFVLTADSVLDWLSRFSVNRFPNDLSINADESDEYYWTRVTLADNQYAFGRYGVHRNFEERRLDINLIRNIAALDVEFVSPWWDYDSLRGHWLNRDSTLIPHVMLQFTQLPTPVVAVQRNGVPIPFVYVNGTLSLIMPPSGDYLVLFNPVSAEPPIAPLPRDTRIVSAYPNPFNSQLSLVIDSKVLQQQTLNQYDVTGRIAKSMTVQLQPGTQQVTVSADGLSSGIYFVSLMQSQHPPVKVVLLK